MPFLPWASGWVLGILFVPRSYLLCIVLVIGNFDRVFRAEGLLLATYKIFTVGRTFVPAKGLYAHKGHFIRRIFLLSVLPPDSGGGWYGAQQLRRGRR